MLSEILKVLSTNKGEDIKLSRAELEVIRDKLKRLEFLEEKARLAESIK